MNRTHKFKVSFMAAGATKWQEVDGYFSSAQSARQYCDMVRIMGMPYGRQIKFDIKHIQEDEHDRTSNHAQRS